MDASLPAASWSFLVLDREFPRAIRHCLRGADESLHAITGTPMGSCEYPSERALAPLRAELDYTSVEEDHRARACTSTWMLCKCRMNTIDDHLIRDFFAGEPLTLFVAAGGQP